MKETNMEHYRGDVKKFLNNKGEFAVTLNGKVENCVAGMCDNCIFSYEHNCDGLDITCGKRRIEWLMSEYKEDPVLTQREKHFVEFAETGWLARDEDGLLNFFKEEPQRREKNLIWVSPNESAFFIRNSVWGNVFPFITWDEGAWSIEELRELKVGDQE